MPNSTILCVWASDRRSLKVKIQKGALHDALVAGRSAGCLVDLWCYVNNERARRSGLENMIESRTEVHGGAGLKVSCWNCHGLSNRGPCLQQLIEDGSRVIVISEHWL